MRPLSELDAEVATRLEGLLFDLDDTLLDHGKLTERAYSSLFRLRESGLRLVALTGRPASWAELFLRVGPLDGAIAENGAIAFRRREGRVELVDPVAREERARRRVALAELVHEARAKIPELVPADDVGGRVTDYTFDIGEHERAEEATIHGAIDFAEARGARTTRSSVHLHFTWDREDKATGALAFLAAEGVAPTRALTRFAFVGDSQNDAPCFAAFRTTFGVANTRGTFSLDPRYRSEGARGAGFAEIAERLVALRAAR